MMIPVETSPPPRCLPPMAEQVLARGLVLSQLGLRASLDLQADHSRAPGMHAELQAWAVTQPVSTEIEEAELNRLLAPLGTLSSSQLMECTWEFEAAAILAWALELLPLANHDELSPAPLVLAAFGTDHPTRMRELLRSLHLRPAEDMVRAATRNRYARHRLAAYRCGETAPDGEWLEEAFALGLPMVGKDLAVDGQALADATPERIEECLLATGPRRRAYRWLLGYALLYSETPRLGKVLGVRGPLAGL